MRVYTYYEALKPEVPGTMQVWKDSWSRFGWEPTVLGEEDFKKHLAWEYYDAATDKLPTINPRGYERACYRRWMAMGPLGGGLMTDYDVVNRGFFPADLGALNITNLTILGEFRVPCAVFGTGHEYLRAALKFASYNPLPGLEHTSDMHLICGAGPSPDWFSEIPICADLRHQRGNPEGYKRTALIHCSNMGSVGFDRVKEMRELMKTGAPR